MVKRDNQGSVQRKLRWVENGVNKCIRASYRGAGYYFVVLGGLHLVFTFFLYPVSTAQNYRGVLEE
jgi:hypothetical protein